MANSPQITRSAYLWQGFRLLGRRELRPFVLIPLLLNIMLFAGLTYFTAHEFGRLTEWVQGLLPSWLAWLSGFLWILFVLALLLIIVYLFTMIANLIGAPFNGLLAEQVEKLMTGHEAESFSFGWLMQEIPYALKMQWKIIAYYLPRACLLLLCFVIPVIQIAAPFIWFAFNAWTMTLQYVDYPVENKRISFSELKSFLHQHRLNSFGFGATVMFTSMIPVVNFFVMPAAVCGATLFWVDKHRDAK